MHVINIECRYKHRGVGWTTRSLEANGGDDKTEGLRASQRRSGEGLLMRLVSSMPSCRALYELPC